MSGLSTFEFLSYLRTRNVTLSVDGQQLRYNAPAGVLTSDLRTELAARKPDILKFFKEARLVTQKQSLSMKRIPREGELQLSFGQMRVWLLDQLEPGGTSYTIPALFRLNGDLNASVLEQSLNEIIRRHEPLRTYFVSVDGVPVQKIAPLQQFKIPVVDLQRLSETSRRSELSRLASLDAAQPFDLTHAPLMRATLVKLGQNEHVFLFNVHHIAFDGWSVGVFIREMSVIYKAFLKGEPSPLPELSIQYVDFAAWQRAWMQGDVFRVQLDYWKTRLGGFLPVLELPFDRPRPAVQTYNGGNYIFTLSRRLTDSLKALSQQEDVTLFVTLLAAFQVLLLRYTEQEDMVVGTPIANRNQPEIEGLLGFFLNVLVMRTDLSGNPTVRELLRRVHETALGAYAHQDLPFEKLVEELNPERYLSHSPVFQVLFSLLNQPMQPLELPGVAPSRLEYHDGASKFDLSLFMEEADQRLTAWFEYNSDLFDEVTIERMGGHLKAILESIVSDPSQRLHQLTMLTHIEWRQLLDQWNDTRADYPNNVSLPELFQRQAAQTPDAIAVECGDRRWTYSQLDARSDQLAAFLQAVGVGPSVLVAVCVERSLEMVLALLGILKSGGAYVPLDPAHPADRIRFIVEDAQSPVLLTQQHLASDKTVSAARIICLDRDWPDIAKESSSPLPIPAAASDLAYVIYTSGSTGRPKGVQIEHRALVNFLSSMQREPGYSPDDVLLAVTTFSFDIAGLELFLPLINGGKVIVATRDTVVDGEALKEQLFTGNVTVMQATPTTWQLLLAADWMGKADLKILCGGEPLPPELAEELLPRCAELWNMYGPTETTVWSTCTRVVSSKEVHIGRPIANTEVYILDPNLQPVPIGVTGELCIGGDGLARGYLNRPELTAEKFIRHPFKSGARLYRTGDLAKYRPDGNIICLGRLDSQVKVRGYRVDLGEIEALLSDVPGVMQVVVALREERLIAYYRSDSGQPVESSVCREILRTRLPDYMVPATYVLLTEIPLTPNGKVDRKALPSPDASPSTDSRTYMPPRTSTEKQLVTIWEEVLRRNPIGVNDNFFDLGGHSLLAVTLFRQIEREFSRRLPLASLFQNPTIRQLANLLKTEQSTLWNSLVCIREGRGGPSIFIVHGAGGNILIYRDLARHMDSRVMVYGLQSQGLDGQQSPLTTIEEMALSYVEEILRQQPVGPYALAGYCMGGKIALEMAQILKEKGHSVALLAMFDSYNVNAATAASFRQTRLSRYRQLVTFHVGNVLAHGPKEARLYLTEKARQAVEAATGWVSSVRKNLQTRTLGRPANAKVPVEDFVYLVNDRASFAYMPREYSGPVTLVKPKRTYSGLKDPKMGWGKVLKSPAEIVELDMNPHAMLVEPFVQDLAAELNVRLRRFSPKEFKPGPSVG
jgi:aspartate racemase